MKSFIVLTFGFLAFAFYEMSGGDDFAPASVRKATLSGAIVPDTPSPAKTAPPSEVILADDEMSKDTPAADENADENIVTRISLNLTSVDSAAKTIKARQAQQSALAPTSVPTNISSADTPEIIPSLIAPNDTGATVFRAAASPQVDFRNVTARRVNVREGPGTDYGVIGKLVAGDTVEILEDTGNGWVRMRNLETGTEGWMADFLLSSS